MKLVIRRLLISLLIVATFSCSLSTGKSDLQNAATGNSRSINRPASQTPPGGIPTQKTPLFVTFGFDDNGYSDSMNWAVDMLATKTNPSGNGNPATYDGELATASFYFASVYGDTWMSESPTFVKRAWRRAYDAGHEIGNHTRAHGHGNQFSIAKWNSELDECNTFLSNPFDPNEPDYSPDITKGIGIPFNEIYGFRTPYLEYNDNLFQALKNKNMYDCSIEEGYQYNHDGTNYYWPYTLDNGSPGHDVQVAWGSKQPIQPQPGLWEMPVYPVIVPPYLRPTLKSRVSWFNEESGKITGFDYNMWVQFKLSKEEFVAIMKHTIDLRLQGNRAPLMIGAHTDYYSSKYTAPPNASMAERRAALEEVLDYALNHQEVRVVSIKKILDWVKNPVPLDGDIIIPPKYTITPSVGSNGSIQPSAPVTINKGSSQTFNLYPNNGYSVDEVYVNNESVYFDALSNTVTISNISQDTTVYASFKQELQNQFTVTTNIENGDITPTQTVTEGSDVTIYFNPNPSNYVLDSVIVNNVEVTPTTTNYHVLYNVTSNQSIKVIYKSQGSGGDQWAEWVNYNVGDIVTFNGSTYSCRMAHTSLPGWTPAAVPALWLLQ